MTIDLGFPSQQFEFKARKPKKKKVSEWDASVPRPMGPRDYG